MNEEADGFHELTLASDEGVTEAVIDLGNNVRAYRRDGHWYLSSAAIVSWHKKDGWHLVGHYEYGGSGGGNGRDRG